MKTPIWQVVVADIKASREIPDKQRRVVDRAIRAAMLRTARKYESHIRLQPEMLRGDEIQIVLRPDAPGLTILTYLRAQIAVSTEARVELRAGIGLGRIERLNPNGPFASDGESFHRAREALDVVKESAGQTLTHWRTGDETTDRIGESVLGLIDVFIGRWTLPQWEAISGRLESKGLQEIARKAGVGFKSVSKRLRAASWSEVVRAIELLEWILQTRVGGRNLGIAEVSARSPSRGRNRRFAPTG